MSTLTRRKLAPGGALRLVIACLFLLCAGLSALSHADTRAVEGFTVDEVVLRGSSELKIVAGDRNRLLVKGDTDELDMAPFYVRGESLWLGRSTAGATANDVQYLLEVDRLERIVLKGSGDIWVDPVEVDSLEVSVEGSGAIYMHDVKASRLDVTVAGSGTLQLARAQAATLSVELAGSGDIDLGKLIVQRMVVELAGSGDITAAAESQDGRVDSIDVSVAGSGEVDLADLVARVVEVNILGSGDVSVHAEAQLTGNIMGSGDVLYRGNPEVDANTMGSGEVSRLD
ncbi:MAG: DUF2807 domain-containing protein [Halieaceae bacterium]|jgi:hypothetical protein|nr:DUF2807 domain-containing protein [Halieaceae bacterium]